MRVGVVLVVLAAIAAALDHQWPASSASPSSRAPSIHAPRAAQHGPLGEADGALPDGTTVFDDALPGVARLDPALLGALR